MAIPRMARCRSNIMAIISSLIPFLLFLVVALIPQPTDAVAAYWWYENATCVDEHTIKGISHLSFDDPDYYSWDTTETKFYGGCFYFTGGYIELGSWNFNDLYNYGTCVVCNNVAGCSSDGTCDTFMTSRPSISYTSSSAYSASSSSSKYSTSTSASSSSYKMSSQAMGKSQSPALASVASKLQQNALQASRQGSSNSKGYTSSSTQEQESSLWTLGSLSGAVVALLVGSLSLVLIIRIRKYWHSKQQQQQPSVDIPIEYTASEAEYYYYMTRGDSELQQQQQRPPPPACSYQLTTPQPQQQHLPTPHTPHTPFMYPHDRLETFASERIIL